MMAFLCAHCVAYKLVLGCSFCGFATGEEIRAGSADGVFGDICDQGSEEEGGEEADSCDLGFVEAVIGGRWGDKDGSEENDE